MFRRMSSMAMSWKRGELTFGKRGETLICLTLDALQLRGLAGAR
jgi:hypothetical protein